MLSRLILIAAGATEAQRKARFAGDEGLEPKSRSLARAMRGTLLRGAVTLTSPARAARETAEAMGLAAELEPALADASAGAWAGRRLDDVASEEPAALMAWMTDPEAAPPGGESLATLAARIQPFLTSRLDTSGTLRAVTHPGVIRVAATLVLGAPLLSAHRIDIGPLTVTEFTSNGQRWHIRRLGAGR